MLFEQQNRKLKTTMFVPAPHGPETAFLEMKQCVDALSSDRLWCNTVGIRSFEPLAPPHEAPIAAFCRREKSLSCCWEKG
jgi:hypothetical protein